MANMGFAERLKALRKGKEFSQNELAGIIEVHFTQVSRYERGETKPNAEAMSKLARAHDTTVDFLMSGSTEDNVQEIGLDKEMMSRCRQVQELITEDRKTVLSFLDAFIEKGKIQSILK